ncbi:MAG: hypothetical protein PHU08_07170 [Dehalococcoidales bacterium]|nr:hypothetical protein [Dehalococcoidales bacterium]
MANAKLSLREKQNAVQKAIRDKLGIPEGSQTYVWIRDMWDDEVIYEISGSEKNLFRVSYTIDADGKVTLGTPEKVVEQTSYKTIESLQAKYADLIQESAKRIYKDDKERIKKVLDLCHAILTTPQGEEIDIGEAIKECDSCIAWLKAQEAAKTEDGESYPASAFAYAPDAEKPSEWKLRLWEDPTKKVTRKQLGAASAALSPGGFRGQKVDIPADDLSAVKRKIRAAYKSLDVPDEDIPKWVKEANEVRDYIHESISVPVAEATTENIAKGIVPIRIIQPGFNSSKSRHYSDSAVKDAVKIFEGAKMYANHATKTEEKERPERDIRDWVATVRNAKVSEKGTAVAEAHIHAGWLKDMVSNLHEHGTLDKLGVSINSIGRGSKQKIDGVETFAVESLVDHPFKSVDFVTEAGAGGAVGVKESPEILDVCIIDLARLKEVRPDLIKEVESEIDTKIKQEAKKIMETQEQIDKLTKDNEALAKERDELKGKLTEADKAKAKAEAQAVIKEAVGKAQLPDAAKARILEQFKEAEKADGIDAAIKAESDYLSKITEQGKVKNLGGSQPDAEKARKELKESFKASYISSGKSEAEAEKLAETAVNGR